MVCSMRPDVGGECQNPRLRLGEWLREKVSELRREVKIYVSRSDTGLVVAVGGVDGLYPLQVDEDIALLAADVMRSAGAAELLLSASVMRRGVFAVSRREAGDGWRLLSLK